MLSILCVLLVIQDAPAQEPPAQQPPAEPADPSGRSGRGRGARRGRTVIDLATARQQLLEQDPPQERDFDRLVESAFQESTNRKLPSYFEDPDALYGPEHLAFRAEVYGPLLAEPRVREFLRSIARRPTSGGFAFSGSTAAMVLADDPDEEDLAALFAGYQATAAEQRASIARQLGRAVAARRHAQPPSPLAEQAFARIQQDALAGSASQRGAALEGLFRAGDVAAALRVVEPLLAEGADPHETVTVLQAAARLFRAADVDPFMKARAIATAEAAVARILEDREELTLAQVLSTDTRTLRAAVSFLQELGEGADFALLLRCVESRRAHRLLGMDGLQNLRFGLQRRRARLEPDQAAALDEAWLRPLLEAGERLFALVEEPMDAEERRHFWEERDLRYNALAYFCDQFLRVPSDSDSSPPPPVPSVKVRLGREPDLPAYLAAIYRAAADETEEGGGSEPRYVAVAEKIENRVLALQLLALIQREWNRDPGGLDLFAEAYTILAAEIHAPITALETIVAFRHDDDPDRTASIPILRLPSDLFVQQAALQTLANLGHVLHTTPTSIRIELDHDHPWPWPANE